jgi:hypothetical protein
MRDPYLYYERSNFDRMLNAKFKKQSGGCCKRNPFLKVDPAEVKYREERDGPLTGEKKEFKYGCNSCQRGKLRENVSKRKLENLENVENYIQTEDYERRIKEQYVDYSNQQVIRKVLTMHDPSNITSYFSYYPLC